MNLDTFFKLLARFIPVSKKRVFFQSFDGLYNDNPKFISEKLHETFPDIKIVWARSNRSKETFPSYVCVVPNRGIRYVVALSRCKVVIENGAGLNYAFLKKRNWIYKFMKKKNQYDIATWHGTPLKKIGYDTKWDNDKYFFSTADVLVAGSSYEEMIYTMSFRNELPIVKMGNPRNDILCNLSDQIKEKMKFKLGLPQNKKILLYAPTFRENVYKSNLKNSYDYLMNLDVDKIISAMSLKFGGEWLFLFRGHQFVQDNINISEYDHFENAILDGNKHDDMAEYLTVSDALITDFSGSLFDYAIVGNPCFLYAPDCDEYVNYNHGIYKDLKTLPYTMSRSTEELVGAIQSYSADEYLDKVSKFKESNGYIVDGKSSERIVNLVHKILMN